AIPNTRNEFPAFNWLLGDLHAHATGFLFLLLALCLLANLQRMREMEAPAWLGLAWSELWACALLTITLSAMWMTNSWDVLVLGLLGAAWIGTESYRKFTWSEFISEEVQGLVLWGIAGILAIKVFSLFFSHNIAMPLMFEHNEKLAGLPAPLSALGAVGLVQKGMYSTITDWFSFWGLFAVALLIALVGRAFKNSVRDWANSPLLALGTCGLLGAVLLVHTCPNLSRVGLLLVVTLLLGKVYVMRSLSCDTLEPAMQWAWILGLVALVFQIIPEFFYLDDPIGSMDSPEGLALQRYNTVFKLYYPAWGLLALAVAIACRNVFQSKVSASDAFNAKARCFSFWPSASLVALLWLMIAGGLYPALGIANRLATSADRAQDWAAAQPTKTDNHFFYGTLNALGFMRLPQYQAGDDLDLALWMRDNLKGSGVLAEASGASYCMTARYSAITGIPCALGWESHEAQWRGKFFSQEIYSKRVTALKQLYESEDLSAKRAACRELGVRWVVLGGLERERYAQAGLEKIAELGKTLKQVGKTTVVEVGENP
ncbi:TPA: hypothetical protein DDW35_03265, partial [Candidatus Sumerlaeota bacterium]|nr:hypothetical protein [Candidatus Sumerlaeota bacterium]